MSDPIRDPALNAVEDALRTLSPAPPALDRDRLMFRAGQASRPPGSRLWPVSTAALVFACVGLATALVLRPEPGVVEKIVVVERVVPQAPAPPDSSFVSHQGWKDYQRLQDQVLKHGLDGLPEAPPAAAVPGLNLLDEMYGDPGIGWPRPNRSGT